MLVEILIGVFFFMISLTVLVQVFAKSRNLTIRSEAETDALFQAQNVIESLYGEENPEEVLSGMGFTSSHGVWVCDLGNYSLLASLAPLSDEAGILWEGNIKAYYNIRDLNQARPTGEELFSLPCVWYREVLE